MKTEFRISEDVETRLWKKYTHADAYEPLIMLENSVLHAGLSSGQLIIIEQQNEDGTWPRQAKR